MAFSIESVMQTLETWVESRACMAWGYLLVL